MGAVGHPAWSSSGEALLVVGEGDESEIFRVVEKGAGTEPELAPLVTAPGFDGHPAGAPVWWQPEPSSGHTGLLP